MKPKTFNRLHTLRMENDAAGYAMEEQRPRFERLAARHENGTAPRPVVVYNLFQTPAALAARLVELLGLEAGARVLEPSAGLGRLLDALHPHQPGEVVAVDSAPQCAAELYQQERAGVIIKQRDFLACTPAELGFFDAIAMNPPFHLRADIRHIKHALQFLKPGGRLAALCLDTPQRAEAFQAQAEEWHKIEPGAFKTEGTGIAAVLMLLRGQA